jgi:hypothetical protein
MGRIEGKLPLEPFEWRTDHFVGSPTDTLCSIVTPKGSAYWIDAVLRGIAPTEGL